MPLECRPVGAFYRIDSMSCKRSHEEIEITANAKVATPIACVFTKNKEKETDSLAVLGKVRVISKMNLHCRHFK